MRPLQLTMTAFGPYKGTEIIRFKELKHQRLFVISGNTGAGKTTIFDAISFALYGEASGTDRQDIRLLRSHFAEDDLHTSVELIFELRGRQYRILRQLAHVKEGNKTATGDRYEFFEIVSDKEIPCVDRQMVTEINRKVEALLGLSKDQFSQIVMLPQGEFRKLLTSETENKEDILRRIFKTEPYKWMTEKLKEKRKDVEGLFNRESQTLQTYIMNIKAALPKREASAIYDVLEQEHYNINQVLIALEQEEVFYKQQVISYEGDFEKQNLLYEKKLNEYHQAKSLNERFQEWDHKKKIHKQMMDQLPEIKEKTRIYDLSEKASHLEVYENHVKEWREDELKQQKAVAESETELKKATERYAEQKLFYEQEQKKEEKRESAKRDLEQLKNKLPIVQAIDDNKKALSILEKTLKQLAVNSEEINRDIQAKKEIRRVRYEDVKRLEEEMMAISKKKEQLQTLREATVILRDYLKFLNEQSIVDQELKKHQAAWEKVKLRYDLIERQWLEGQAGLLASQLHHGQPCPVCGNVEHPNKAILHEEIPTKDELDSLKKEREEKEKKFHDSLATWQSLERNIKSEREKMKHFGLDEGQATKQYKMNVEKGKQLKQEVDHLEKEQGRLLQLRKSLEELEHSIEKKDIEKQKTEAFYQEKKTAFETQKALYEQSLKEIPEELRTLQALEKRIDDGQTYYQELEASWKKAQEHYQLSKDHLTKVSSALDNLTKQYKETNRKRRKAEEQFLQECKESGFLEEADYLKAKLPMSDRKALKEDIAAFEQQRATVEQQLKEFEENLKGKERADLTRIEQVLLDVKNQREVIEEKLRTMRTTHEHTMKLMDNIRYAHRQVEEQEKKLQMVSELYDVVRGQNSKKISFERYLQIEYLEQIVQSANQRLHRLSNGQYSLIRSDRQESRGKQSGLGLDVYDAYTGQTRDVKSLSGGEKFHASLCLALGMSDVIQSFQGGVSIDTMFIDEGFGSLDEESLIKAIDTLIELQKTGRMIGVISHVQELKSAIPAILEVEKTKEGYSQTRFTIR